ncbi:L,D-transpeptidase family protein [Stakelama marina]|uniref:L,D-transpeptidase family protein n=1 Tax=Stakelama marina TaxID=2826939 RepID=UPI0024C23946|nr:L,D-transpeptidase family protein [Stakelama marina]
MASTTDSSPPTIDASALRDAAKGDVLNQFYQSRNWQAAWSPAAEQALRQELADRARHGLDRVTFLPNTEGATPAALDVALTKAALYYAGALARGLTDPTKLHKIYTIPRPDIDLPKGLQKALETGKVGEWFDSLAPQTDEYRALSKAYLDQSKAAKRETRTEIGHGDLIHVGEHDPRVPLIAKALESSGYLEKQPDTAPAPADGGDSSAQDTQNADLYTPRIETAVKQLQTDFGIADDGIVGPDTLSALNAGPAEHARSLAVALDRRRWLSRTPPATRIDVNTAAAELQYFRDGQPVNRRKVIVGQPGKETPQLQAPIFRLVANPTWTVPRSIQRTEMAGKSQAYFRRNNLEWRNGWIVQKSGEGNALGLVKFDMKDGQAIYLHDTSARSLFDRNVRQLSHGCVRVHDALGFADMIASDEGVVDKWQKARTSGENSYVPLPKEIPVRLLYHPAFVGAAGQVQYRPDNYGWNDPIAKALGFGGGGGQKYRTSFNDIGP